MYIRVKGSQQFSKSIHFHMTAGKHLIKLPGTANKRIRHLKGPSSVKFSGTVSRKSAAYRVKKKVWVQLLDKMSFVFSFFRHLTKAKPDMACSGELTGLLKMLT